MKIIYYILFLMAPLITHSQEMENPNIVSPTRISFEVKLYPNPSTTGSVTITTGDHIPIEVKVFDVFGEVVHWETLRNNKLDTTRLQPGVYVVQIKQGQNITTRKLVIK